MLYVIVMVIMLGAVVVVSMYLGWLIATFGLITDKGYEILHDAEGKDYWRRVWNMFKTHCMIMETRAKRYNAIRESR